VKFPAFRYVFSTKSTTFGTLHPERVELIHTVTPLLLENRSNTVEIRDMEIKRDQERFRKRKVPLC
jgi:hypothetical protein